MDRPARPIVIAHRGASGYRPEHTLESYRLAIAQGADFIEPDLVATGDGALICRHENALAVLNADGSLNTQETSTDIYRRADFAARLTTKRIDGRSVRGWFSEDFTLAEIRTLRAVERIPALRPANAAYNGRYPIPTFDEVLELLADTERTTGRAVGVYPETKHPSYFLRDGRTHDGRPIAIDLGMRLIERLHAHGFTAPSRVFIQSFEVENLRALRRAGVGLPLIQLIEADGAPYDGVLAGRTTTYREMVSAAGLREIATYAGGIGVAKGLLVPRDAADTLTQPTSVVRDAHACGLLVHAWTFRAENHFLPAPLRTLDGPTAHGALAAEIAAFVAAGVDGVFCDQPDIARSVVQDRDARPGRDPEP